MNWIHNLSDPDFRNVCLKLNSKDYEKVHLTFVSECTNEDLPDVIPDDILFTVSFDNSSEALHFLCELPVIHWSNEDECIRLYFDKDDKCIHYHGEENPSYRKEFVGYYGDFSFFLANYHFLLPMFLMITSNTNLYGSLYLSSIKPVFDENIAFDMFKTELNKLKEEF